jgi:SAM-dependent methyltransferase
MMDIWSGNAARGWVESQESLDRVFQPFEDLLVEAVAAGGGTRVLDVGCGTGGTTLAIARRLGATAQCTGIDISEAMIAAARARVGREESPVCFLQADAETHAFEPAGFDAIVSRFGVMFFQDPVRAFRNLRVAAADGAELRFIAWRSAAENPFMTTAERAAAPLLPNLPVRREDEPGQFAFGDRGRVHDILRASGWSGTDIQPIDVPCTVPEREMVAYLTRLGPVGRALQESDERTRAQVIQAVRPAFDPYVHGDEVRLPLRAGSRAPRPPPRIAVVNRRAAVRPAVPLCPFRRTVDRHFGRLPFAVAQDEHQAAVHDDTVRCVALDAAAERHRPHVQLDPIRLNAAFQHLLHHHLQVPDTRRLHGE